MTLPSVPTPPIVFDEAASFATGPYARALLQGSALPATEEADIARTLSGFVGVSPADLIRSHLRIDVETWRSTVRRDEGLMIGRLDSRVTAPIPAAQPNRPSAANDPALGLGRSNVIRSVPITAYFRQELGLNPAQDFISLTLDVNFQWTWPPMDGRGKTPGTTVNLAAAMAAHPSLKAVLVGGYFDMAVPALMPRYALSHAWLPMNRVRIVTREAGHSVFEGVAGRQEMKSLITDLIDHDIPGK